MINSTDFGNRIKKIMEFYELTASTFAEKINVQRSSISHILSGRNKPSLDFILKISNNFNEVDLYWLLYEKGSFPKQEHTTKEKTENKNSSPTLPNLTKQHRQLQNDIPKKEIKRIVIFYTDDTFEEYRN